MTKNMAYGSSTLHFQKMQPDAVTWFQINVGPPNSPFFNLINMVFFVYLGISQVSARKYKPMFVLHQSQLNSRV